MTREPEKTTLDVHSAVWLIPAVLLALAVFPLPYGYYSLLRIVVTVGVGYLAYTEIVTIGQLSIWSILMSLVAMLFNPVIPIHLSRETWAPVDLGCAALLVLHWRIRT